jgi:hypothetical protein
VSGSGYILSKAKEQARCKILKQQAGADQFAL